MYQVHDLGALRIDDQFDAHAEVHTEFQKSITQALGDHHRVEVRRFGQPHLATGLVHATTIFQKPGGAQASLVFGRVRTEVAPEVIVLARHPRWRELVELLGRQHASAGRADDRSAVMVRPGDVKRQAHTEGVVLLDPVQGGARRDVEHGRARHVHVGWVYPDFAAAPVALGRAGAEDEGSVDEPGFEQELATVRFQVVVVPARYREGGVELSDLLTQAQAGRRAAVAAVGLPGRRSEQTPEEGFGLAVVPGAGVKERGGKFLTVHSCSKGRAETTQN